MQPREPAPPQCTEELMLQVSQLNARLALERLRWCLVVHSDTRRAFIRIPPALVSQGRRLLRLSSSMRMDEEDRAYIQHCLRDCQWPLTFLQKSSLLHTQVCSKQANKAGLKKQMSRKQQSSVFFLFTLDNLACEGTNPVDEQKTENQPFSKNTQTLDWMLVNPACMLNKIKLIFT